ncbi:MAG: hypothetical protein IE881_02735 [Epsilonproteobacteria bacterium]|nr:hypothetical protein [Campylobacterota bacterium]
MINRVKEGKMVQKNSLLSVALCAILMGMNGCGGDRGGSFSDEEGVLGVFILDTDRGFQPLLITRLFMSLVMRIKSICEILFGLKIDKVMQYLNQNR